MKGKHTLGVEPVQHNIVSGPHVTHPSHFVHVTQPFVIKRRSVKVTLTLKVHGGSYRQGGPAPACTLTLPTFSFLTLASHETGETKSPKLSVNSRTFTTIATQNTEKPVIMHDLCHLERFFKPAIDLVEANSPACMLVLLPPHVSEGNGSLPV